MPTSTIASRISQPNSVWSEGATDFCGAGFAAVGAGDGGTAERLLGAGFGLGIGDVVRPNGHHFDW